MSDIKKLKRISPEEEQLLSILRAVKLPAAEALAHLVEKMPMLQSVIEYHNAANRE